MNTTPVSSSPVVKPRRINLAKMKVGDWVQLTMNYGVMGKPFYAKDGDYFRTVRYAPVIRVNKKSFTIKLRDDDINMTEVRIWSNSQYGVYSTGFYIKATDYEIVKKFNESGEVEYFDI